MCVENLLHHLNCYLTLIQTNGRDVLVTQVAYRKTALVTATCMRRRIRPRSLVKAQKSLFNYAIQDNHVVLKLLL